MNQAAAGPWHATLTVNTHGVEGTQKVGCAIFLHPANGFRVGVIIVGMGGNEEVNIQILRLDEDRQLAIEAVGKVGEGSYAAVAEIKINSDQQTFGILEQKSILSQIPDRGVVRWNLKLPDRPHISATIEQSGHDILNRRSSVIGVVPGKDVGLRRGVGRDRKVKWRSGHSRDYR